MLFIATRSAEADLVSLRIPSAFALAFEFKLPLRVLSLRLFSGLLTRLSSFERDSFRIPRLFEAANALFSALPLLTRDSLLLVDALLTFDSERF